MKASFSNVSVDLIFGIPGQTLPHWMETIERATGLGVQHLSTYGLTFEAGTAFWSRRLKGQLSQIPDDLERAMYEAAMDRLPAAGYPQYEISNFARPGFECRHNQVYWRAEPFFGFGPGAAAYVDGVRRTNHRSVTTWLKRTLAGEPAVGESEKLDREGSAREAVMLGFRPCVGISRTAFRERYSVELESLAGDAFAGFVSSFQGSQKLRVHRSSGFANPRVRKSQGSQSLTLGYGSVGLPGLKSSPVGQHPEGFSGLKGRFYQPRP